MSASSETETPFLPRPGTVERLPASVKLGALGLAIPLIGGRWGSYIGVAPLYLADVLLILAAFWTLATPSSYPIRVRFPAVYWLCWSATGLFIVASLLHGSGDMVTRIRDLIPWFYLLLLPAVMQWALAAGSRRILNYLTITLLIHAAWAIPSLLNVLPNIELGSQIFGQPLFSNRPDVDVPLLAASVVLVIYRWGSRPSSVLFTVLAAGAAAAQTSRAALVGSCIAILVLARAKGLLRGAQGFVRMLGVLAVVAIVVLVLLPAITARSADRFDSGALARAGLYGSAQAASSGAGTANARFAAWEILLDHYAEVGYPALGVGAGAEVVRDTGAVNYLSGDVDVRAPHNWWVHVLVRTGYLGTTLWIALLLLGARLSPARATRTTGDFLAPMGALLIVSMLLAGTLGVVIEAPFGSQILLIGAALVGLPVQHAEARSHKLPARAIYGAGASCSPVPPRARRDYEKPWAAQ